MTEPEAQQHSARARVIVGVDGSSSAQAALDWGAEEAVLRGSELHVVTSVHGVAGFGEGLVIRADEDEERAVARAGQEAALTEALAGRDLQATQHIVDDDPADALINLADSQDLIVVGKHSRSGLADAFTGSVSRKVADRAPCPVVIVRSQLPQ